MSELPALLLTDVVDSTKLSERLGDEAMAEVWAGHDRVARDLLPLWRGREIDKTDGMLLLFEDAADAVHYALAYHRALDALAVPLKARAGLHVGPVILRENSADDVARGAKPLEVDGLAKPTAARVMSLAVGGQTLLTPEARAAVGDIGLPTVSHGHWVMKGVSAPIELFEAGEDPACFAPPPDSEKVYRVVRVDERWLPARQIPNNLPQQATVFIGREREINELKAALGQSRLVTLLGMGGLGKTRLSLQVAAEVMAEYPEGAWFLDLSPIRDPALVVVEAAQVLGVREEPGHTLLQTLCTHLATRRVLLVMDNCEHLVRSAADLAQALLRHTTGVRLITSSREALRVPGERAVPILPLPVPARDDSLEMLQRSTAVRLFVARAQSHKPAFTLNERDAPAVAELVARLEGIPLALELAAARVRALSVADINKRLGDRYKVLTGGSRVLQERQQTLRALVDWSYELLGSEEQLVFKRLAVFAGGFDLAAAEAVCGADPLDTMDVMDLLQSMVEKSLVMMEERDEVEGGTRYRMLETLRDYAHEKLLTDADDAPATDARHAQHYFVVAKHVRDGLQGPEQAPWIERAEIEIDNLRSALRVALAGGVDPVIAVKMAMALQSFFLLRGYVGEGRVAVRAALALPAVQAADRSQAWALYVGAVLASGQNDHAEARQMLERGLVLARRLGNLLEIAATLSTLTVAQLQGGDAHAAMASETEALALFQQIRHQQGEVIGHLHLGQCASALGEAAQAAGHLQRGLALAREIGQQEIEAECTFELGQLAAEGKDATGARRWLDDSMRVSHDSGNKRGEACALWGLAQQDLAHGDITTARPLLQQALRAFRDFEMREQMLGCLESLAELALQEAAAGDPGALARAATLAESAEQLRQRWQLLRPRRLLGRWEALMQGLGAWVPSGKTWSAEEAVQAGLQAPAGVPA